MMDNTLNMVSYNCRGLPKTPGRLWEKPTLHRLLQNKSLDIIALQETFLSKQDLGCLNVLSTEFQGVGASTTDTRDKMITGHPHGGVAILYRVNLSKSITPLNFNLDWVVGISVTSGNYSHVILCVYLKCASGRDDHKEIFQGQLEELKFIIEGLDTTSVSIIGDMNADIMKPTHTHGPLLRQFAIENGLIISSEILLPSDSFTYVSEMRAGETSWLDHCVSTEDGHGLISDISIDYQSAISDHIPLYIKLNINKLPIVMNENNNVTPKIKWERYDSVKLREYNLMTDINLHSISLPVEVVNCRDNLCCDIEHIKQTKLVYDRICKSLVNASCSVLGTSNKGKFNCKPGFNEHVREKHDIARKRFVAWINANRPREPNNPFFREMVTSRAIFKLALRFIKSHEAQLRQDAIAESLCNDSEGNFWKEIKKLSPNNIPIPISIDNATGAKEVVSMWQEHFKSLLNCINGNDSRTLALDLSFDPNIEIKDFEIEDAINKLKGGKSCGIDGIYAEHLKHSTNRIWGLLAQCFTSCFVHGFLPDSLMSVILCPIVKDKAGKINSKDNYRPIAIASIMSKLLEIIMLERLSNHLITNDNQFGFKSKHSTDACIYVLKEAVEYYNSQHSSVYMCFLDASKAFDRVNHYILFEKLISKGVPGYLIRTLIFWYSNQKMSVRWGSLLSDSFTVTNGVRQGGILSPYLFNVYMDDLSKILKTKYAGCRIGNQIINHLFYADDLVLLCPSQRGMQDLLKMCEDYAKIHDIKFNANKSVVVIRRAKLLKNVVVKPFTLCKESLNEVMDTKYLGHIITADGKDDKDIIRACRQLYAQGNSLTRKFNFCSEKVKIKLFITYCSQFYCAQLWKCGKSNKAYRKINVAYNNVFRNFLKLPRLEDGRPCSASTMFVTRKLRSFQEIIRNVVFKFRNRLDLSSNSLVKNTFIKNIKDASKLRRHWNTILLAGGG